MSAYIMRQLIDYQAQAVPLWRLHHSSTTDDMPADRTRSTNSQGRQKSCHECARGKRKCDLQQPGCTRCTRLNLACTWPSQHAHASSATTPTSPADGLSTVEAVQSSGTTLLTAADTPSISMALDANFLDSGLDLPPSCYFLEGVPDAGTAIAPPLCGMFSQPPILPSLHSFSTAAESRIGYSLKQWELAPAMMVQQNCTYWSHSKLYEECMPQSMAGKV